MTTWEQPSLLDSIPAPDREPTLAERFAAYHAANPAVYEVLVRLAREWIRRTGRHRIGIAALVERARWEIALTTTETPKINNDYRAFYARMIMEREPDLTNLFEIRRSAADDLPEAA